jgi:hypothetical protein
MKKKSVAGNGAYFYRGGKSFKVKKTDETFTSNQSNDASTTSYTSSLRRYSLNAILL